MRIVLRCWFLVLCLSAAHNAFGRECRFEYDPAAVATYYRAEGWTLPGIADFNPSAAPHFSDMPPLNHITGTTAELLPHNEYPYIVEFPAQEFVLNGSPYRTRPTQMKASIVRWKMSGHVVAYSYGLIPVEAHKIGAKWNVDSEAGCLFTATFIDDRGDGTFRVLVPNRLTLDLIPRWAKADKGGS